jgi:DNA repair photolyase
MDYKQITTSSLLTKITKKDALFGGKYTLDPYQRCEFNCVYCDSGDEIIYVKSNAPYLLETELATQPKGTIIIGSASDPYQPAENTYKITRALLTTIREHDYPCHILTKSDRILRDLDLLTTMDQCAVTISIISLNDRIATIFEPKSPPPKDRLRTVRTLSENSVKTGIAIIPLLPYIVDQELEALITSAQTYKARYILHQHLELKGDQKTIFLHRLRKFFPHLSHKYGQLYLEGYLPDQQYMAKTKKLVVSYCKNLGIPCRI